jgi:hypothetical protein
MIDPITTGMVCVAVVMLALIGKGWSAQAGTTRIEVAKIEAQKRSDDLDRDVSLSLEHAEEALRLAKDAHDKASRFESRLSAAENRRRAG